MRYEFHCRYEDSAQDETDGVMKMHRRVTSEDIEDYSSHIPRDIITLDQEEDIVYRKGVLAHLSLHCQDDATGKPLNFSCLLLYCPISQFCIICRMIALTRRIWKENLWKLN